MHLHHHPATSTDSRLSPEMETCDDLSSVSLNRLWILEGSSFVYFLLYPRCSHSVNNWITIDSCAYVLQLVPTQLQGPLLMDYMNWCFEC